MKETRVQSLGQEDPLEEGMATNSSVLAWRSPRTEEPGGLQSLGYCPRVGHARATQHSTAWLVDCVPALHPSFVFKPHLL